MTQKIRIEVAYALPQKQIIKVVEVDVGVTVEQAIERSGLLQEFPEIDLKINKVGIFGQPSELDARLQDQDRVEIYRSIIVDPKLARQQRARLPPNS